VPGGESAGGFGHPFCGFGEKEVTGLPSMENFAH